MKYLVLYLLRVTLFYKTNRVLPLNYTSDLYILWKLPWSCGEGEDQNAKNMYTPDLHTGYLITYHLNFLGHKRIPGLQRWRPWPSQFYERTHAKRGCNRQGWGGACPGARWGAGSRSAQCSTRIFLPWICTNGDNYWMSLKFSPISTFYLLLYVQEILTYFI